MKKTINIFDLIKAKEQLCKSIFCTLTYNLIFSKTPLSITDQETLDSYLASSLIRIIYKAPSAETRLKYIGLQNVLYSSIKSELDFSFINFRNTANYIYAKSNRNIELSNHMLLHYIKNVKNDDVVVVTVDNVVKYIGTIRNGIIDWKSMLLMINNSYITSKIIPSDDINNEIVSSLIISNIK